MEFSGAEMSKRIAAPAVPLLFLLICSPASHAQAGAPAQSAGAKKKDDWWTTHDKWDTPLPDKSEYSGRKDGPAPRRDLSGTWDGLAEGGTQPKGAKDYPDDAAHRPEPPYTPLGKQARLRNVPGEGEDQAPVGQVNDPVDSCEPVGFPRTDLFSLKAMAIVQTPKYVIWLNKFYNVYRTIWIDGRELPKDPVPRFYGYSVGHWEDDYNLVVETVGLDDKTWLDNVGRPHSDALHVTERFHRVSRDILELTVTIDDPKIYTKPWVAADKLKLHLLPEDFDMGEMLCSPGEMENYKKQIAEPISGAGK
jgi:hypothetical protein